MAEATYPTNTMVTGEITIQQTERNKLRREALEALRNDLAR